MLLTVLAENNHHLLFLRQRIWKGNIIFPGVEPKAVRHIMFCLLHSVSLCNRNCKCSNGQERRQLRLQDWDPPMSCTEFTQHPQPSSHYKRHPLSLIGYKLYRGNLRARGISTYLDIPATSTTAILDAGTSRPCLQHSGYSTVLLLQHQVRTSFHEYSRITSLHHSFSTANTYQNH